MKIGIVTPGFGEPTIPFAQNLYKAGHSCDIYILSLQGRTNCGTLDFDKPIKGDSIYQVNKENAIYRYLDKTINVYNVAYYLEKNKKYLIGFIAYLKNRKIVNKLVATLKDKSYDAIYVVAHEMIDAMVCNRLRKNGVKNVYISYHEILRSHFGEPVLTNVVKRTMNLGYPLLTYSNYNKSILEKFTSAKVHTLYFGPFETYNIFDTSQRIIENDYILFIGSIQPYKGLQFLYDTICNHSTKSPFTIVVAGSGNDDVLHKIKSDERFILINRYLKDEEFANLTRYAICVVCPYKAGSQSGITHTAMVFGTPVVATKVAAFPEFIRDRVNGSIVEYGDKKALFDKLLYYASSKSRNITIPNHLRWDNIIVSFESIIAQKNIF